MKSTFLVAALVLLAACASPPPVRTGADVLLSDRLDLIQGKSVGVVTNHSALLSDGRHLVDALHALPDVEVKVLFGPEHGIRGDAPDGHSITDGLDAKTGVQVYSLYGAIRKPTPEMLKDVDMLIFDIQDVGARFYTYESTMSYAMEAAAENGIPYVVLDRPNPITGNLVEGFIRVDSLRSFVGLHPIPIAHGMTIGELAKMFNGEGWLEAGIKADLLVIPCEGWTRDQWYDETGLAWVKPSPNMATLATATLYPGTCLFEGTNLSEGRGTPKPFETIGAPYINGEAWARALNASALPGVTFEPATFTPVMIPNTTNNPKYKDEPCSGVTITVTDRDALQPVRTAVEMLVTARKLFPESVTWRERGIDRLAGTPAFRMAIDEGKQTDEIVQMWASEVKEFSAIRAGYLLYQ